VHEAEPRRIARQLADPRAEPAHRGRKRWVVCKRRRRRPLRQLTECHGQPGPGRAARMVQPRESSTPRPGTRQGQPVDIYLLTLGGAHHHGVHVAERCSHRLDQRTGG
jgi:hypothetical protein